VTEQKIVIDPMTRLEGHGRIEIFLDQTGAVSDVFWQVLELRGFERFCIGRPAEEMLRIVPNICGVCPTAHYMAAAKALDAVFNVTAPPTANLLRRLAFHAALIEDHLLHFFFLAGPDLFLDEKAAVAQRNIFGVIEQLGQEIGREVMEVRRRNREIVQHLFSKASHPEGGFPGGVSRGVTEEDRGWLRTTAENNITFIRYALELFRKRVLRSEQFQKLLHDDAFQADFHSLALVDKADRMAFFDGKVKIVDADGKTSERFLPAEYRDFLAESTEPWTYARFAYLKKIGWQGLQGGRQTALYQTGPLARLNVAVGMASPMAQKEFDLYRTEFGRKPVKQILAGHWARLICALQAAEEMSEMISGPNLTGRDLRNKPGPGRMRGVGCVEAPRGTLFHDYETDEQGILTRVNLIVPTQHNVGPICIAVKKAAQAFIHGDKPDEYLLNRVESAYRVFDPCLACATHALGRPALNVVFFNHSGKIIREVGR